MGHHSDHKKPGAVDGGEVARGVDVIHGFSGDGMDDLRGFETWYVLI